MAAVDKNLYGSWKMTAMKFQKPDGNWEYETVYGGTSTFTESGLICTFTRTSELAFGYSGSFEIIDNVMAITPEVCSITNLEGTRLVRKVKKVTAQELILGMVDDATGRNYEIEFKLITRSFTR